MQHFFSRCQSGLTAPAQFQSGPTVVEVHSIAGVVCLGRGLGPDDPLHWHVVKRTDG